MALKNKEKLLLCGGFITLPYISLILGLFIEGDLFFLFPLSILIQPICLAIGIFSFYKIDKKEIIDIEQYERYEVWKALLIFLTFVGLVYFIFGMMLMYVVTS